MEMEKKELTQGQINKAACDIREFSHDTSVSIEDFADYFYDVASQLGYDSGPFVQLLEAKFKDECSEVILRIKVTEGW